MRPRRGKPEAELEDDRAPRPFSISGEYHHDVITLEMMMLRSSRRNRCQSQVFLTFSSFSYSSSCCCCCCCYYYYYYYYSFLLLLFLLLLLLLLLLFFELLFSFFSSSSPSSPSSLSHPLSISFLTSRRESTPMCPLRSESLTAGLSRSIPADTSRGLST